jgi:hypothetical protein
MFMFMPKPGKPGKAAKPRDEKQTRFARTSASPRVMEAREA